MLIGIDQRAAHSYPADNVPCPDIGNGPIEIEYYFDDVPANWEQGLRDAFEEWETHRNQNGFRSVTFTEVPEPPSPTGQDGIIGILAMELAPFGALGAAVCTQPPNNPYDLFGGNAGEYLVLDDDLSVEEAIKVGMHEAGHLAGALHTGAEDNTLAPNEVPIMACLVQPQHELLDQEFTHDDATATAHMHSPIPAFAELSANMGFEGDNAAKRKLYWRVLGNAQLLPTVSTEAPHGQAYMRVDVDAAESGIWQQGTISPTQELEGANIQVKASVRNPDPAPPPPASQPQYRMQLVVRAVGYDPLDSTPCHLTPYDWNRRHLWWAWVIELNGLKDLPTSFSQHQTGQWTVPSPVDTNGPTPLGRKWDAFDYKIRLKRVSVGNLDVDDLRLRRVS